MYDHSPQVPHDFVYWGSLRVYVPEPSIMGRLFYYFAGGGRGKGLAQTAADESFSPKVANRPAEPGAALRGDDGRPLRPR